MAPIDDSALRLAAQQLLRAARLQMAGVNWAAEIVEREKAFFVVEIAIDRDGPMATTLLLDLGREQKILAEFKSNGHG
jgi:hypothetical protein